MFSAIDVDKMVSCCGSLYSSSATSYVSNIFRIDTEVLLFVFYGNFVLIGLFYLLKNKYLFALSNLSFIVSGVITLIAFFGMYIYQLPTHHCPFCFLQNDYYYVGYLIYFLLFIGTFSGIGAGLLPASNTSRNIGYKISLLFNGLYVLLLSLYPLFFYIKNGVWL
jgi:hypothetical protein